MADRSLLRVRLLGGLAVDGWTERELGSRKGRTILKVLALERGSFVSVDRLVDVLWADDVPARPADQIGVLVARLRGVIGGGRVERGDAGYRLVVDWLDLDELDRRIEEAAESLARGRLGAARTSALAAIAVARGELLPGDEGPWIDAARLRVAAQLARAHHLAAAASSDAGDHAAAAASAEAALAHDPYDEVALRSLMRSHVAAARPSSALAAYVRVRERVAADLGVDLSPETEALHDQIVLGDYDVAASTDTAHAARATATVVGRRPELERLDQLLESVRGTSRPAIALVSGQAGIGKSAIVSAWCERVDPRVVVMRGRCDELGRDLPLQPISDALSAHLGVVGEAEAHDLLGADAPIIADLLGLSGLTTSATTIPDADAGQARLFSALLAVVGRAARADTVVITIEDLHLAGTSTLRWLAFAQRRGAGLFVVATTRGEHPEMPTAELIDVGPLERDDAYELLSGIGADRMEDLYARSGGNPLLLLALATADEGEEMPSSVRDAVQRQTTALGAAGATIEAAAVLGAGIDLDLLADVLRRPAVDVLSDLEAAMRAGLLDEHTNGLAFRHELVRAALEQSAGSTRRAFVHREAARRLAARPLDDPLSIAVHARLGGETALAIAAYERAAARAYARFDVDAARTHLDSALALGDSTTALILRARVHMSTMDFDAAATDAAEAIARDGGAAALEIAGWVAYYQRRYPEARAYAERGVLLAGDDAALRASCLAVAGRIRHGAGDLDGAIERLRSTAGAPLAVQGVADVWLAQLQVHRGENEAALRTLEQPLVDPDHLAHPWAPLHGRFARVMALGHLGRPGEALVACDELDAAVRRAGPIGARFRGPAGNVRAWLLRHVGSPEQADDVNQDVREFTAAPGGGPLSDSVAEYHYVALLDLADGRLIAGDLDGAATLLELLGDVDNWTGTMAWHQRHRLELLRARLAIAGGDMDLGRQHAWRVIDDAAARGTRRYEVMARAWLALASDESDVDAVGTIVGSLPGVASMEAWRLTAALADRYRVDAWRKEAARQAAALAASSGPHAERFRRVAQTVLDP